MFFVPHRLENRLILKSGVILIFVILGYITFALPAIMTLTFTTFVATGGVLTLQRVFTVFSLVDIVRINSMSDVNHGLFLLLESLVAAKRIQVS